MKLIPQSWEWIQKPEFPLQLIETAGRVCYKSKSDNTLESAKLFTKKLLSSDHHSVIEHASASIKIITNRGVTHELVRHRLCSFSQESTRYCNYGGKELEFIKPAWWVNESRTNNSEFLQQVTFKRACEQIELNYNILLNNGWRPEQAREILPNALKTEIVMTTNLREWRHIFALRTSPKAHPQIRSLMIDILSGFKKEIPIIFDDI